MKMVKLTCPYCGATLSVENGLDLFYCQYCGGRIMLTGQDSNMINAKVKLKEFEHRERLQQNNYAFQERIRKNNQDYELKNKEVKSGAIARIAEAIEEIVMWIVVLVVIIGVMVFILLGK